MAAILMALLIGVLAPPWLSTDAYGYIAYGRMQAIYGLNPYQSKPSSLLGFDDPVFPFLEWDVVSVYGPLWSWLMALIALALKSFPLLTSVIVVKLVAFMAHIFLAFGVAQLARMVAPRLEAAAFIFVAFSPLYVIEGPGSGHNDAVMLCLVIWGVVHWQRGNLRRACLLIGLAGATKFIAFPLLFWLIGRHFFGHGRNLALAIKLAAIGCLPFLMLQLYFVSNSTGLFEAIAAYFADTPGKHAMPRTSSLVFFFAVFLGCSLAVIFTRLMHWTSAWTIVTSLAIVTIGPPWPWYLMWPGIFLLTGYSKRLQYAVIPYIGAGYLLMLGYSITP